MSLSELESLWLASQKSLNLGAAGSSALAEVIAEQFAEDTGAGATSAVTTSSWTHNRKVCQVYHGTHARVL